MARPNSVRHDGGVFGLFLLLLSRLGLAGRVDGFCVRHGLSLVADRRSNANGRGVGTIVGCAEKRSGVHAL